MGKVDGIAIKVTNVNKTFKLPHEKQNSIKGLFVNMFRRKRTYEKQHVLKDISFEIKKGEFFGIVGRNGSGKSTLLKLLAGIYSPDSGHIQVNGKLTPFIELGVGFNPELTGRENVFLNGALLGFSRKEMLAMYDEIVEFAELEKFMDQKLKNYSSGMQVRLAFSVAIRAETEILLVDEVLAVGDQSFQEKCYKFFAQIKNTGRTVILVTHDMGSVERFCDRVLLVDKSQNDNGIYTVKEAAALYNSLNHGKTNKNGKSEARETKDKKAYIKKITLKNNKNQSADKFLQGEPLVVEIEVENNDLPPKSKIVLGLAIHDNDNVNLAGPNSLNRKLSIGSAKFQYSIERIPFNMGVYQLTVALFDEFVAEQYDISEKEVTFFVNTEETRHGKIVLEGNWSAIK